LLGSATAEAPGPNGESAGMIGAGGNIGGGACSRSITDFATSAAERIVSGVFWARALAARCGLICFDKLLAAVLEAAFGFRRAAWRGSAAEDLRTAGLSLSVAAGLGARVIAEAASTFRRACFAARFSILNNFRACLSCAFAARTSVFAAAARAAALIAAVLSRLMKGDGGVIYGNTRTRN
jgi:hypothetical protein